MTAIDIDDVAHEVIYEPSRVEVQIDGHIEESPGFTACSKPFGWARDPGEPYVVLRGGYRRGSRTDTAVHAMRSSPDPVKVTCIECLSVS